MIRWRRLAHRPEIAGGLVGLAAGALALGPGLGPGYLLSYDMVFVPRPAFNAMMFGFGGTLPRAVPSDAVVAVLARVLPADVVQKLILLAIFVLAASGIAALLSEEHQIARIAAAVCYVWNPYLAERLIIGQWALLLGYAGLPWVLQAVGGRRPRPARRGAVPPGLTSEARREGGASERPGPRGVPGGRPPGLTPLILLALVPAAIGGFEAMCVSALVAVPAALAASDRTARQRLERGGIVIGILVLLSLPWLIPALAATVPASGSGVSLFAARADTPFGSVGSLLMLGGVWNAQVTPARYGGLESAFWLALVIIAIGCFAFLGRRRLAGCRGLTIAAIAGFALACLGVTGAGRDVLRSMIAFWPGFAVLRDGQQFVAPLAVLVSLGFGLGVSAAIGALSTTSARDMRWLAATIALLAPVVLLPGLAWGANGRLRPVRYPADWLAARRLIDSSPVRGNALLLPWAAYRRFGWNHGEAVLDPWPRLLRRDVIWNDGVQVGTVTLRQEDPHARALNPVITSGRVLTGQLEAANVSYVIVDAGFAEPAAGRPSDPASLPFFSRLPGCRVVLSGPGLIVYQLPRQA